MANMVQMPRKPDWTSSFTDKMIEGAELMSEGDLTQKEVAIKIGVDPQTISRRWKHNPLWMQYVNYLATLNTLESALKIKGLTTKAVEKLGKLLDSGDDAIAMRAVKEILDRAGVKDLEFDLLPKSEKKLDLDSVKARFRNILEADEADAVVIDVTNYQSFGGKANAETQMPYEEVAPIEEEQGGIAGILDDFLKQDITEDDLEEDEVEEDGNEVDRESLRGCS